MKADHTHSLTQHRAAVDRELQRLARCRERRFRAEDSRVKTLQDSVKNLSLVSHWEEGEEGEADEVSSREEVFVL